MHFLSGGVKQKLAKCRSRQARADSIMNRGSGGYVIFLLVHVGADFRRLGGSMRDAHHGAIRAAGIVRPIVTSIDTRQLGGRFARRLAKPAPTARHTTIGLQARCGKRRITPLLFAVT